MINFILYYLVINLLAFLLFGNDKMSAKKKKWRIPESYLFGISYLGGALGSWIGMKYFHHKTKTKSFLINIPIALGLHIFIFTFLFFKII